MINPYSDAVLRGLNFIPFAVRICGLSCYGQTVIPTGIIPAQSSEVLLLESVSANMTGTYTESESSDAAGRVAVRMILAGTTTEVSPEIVMGDDFLMSPAMISESVATFLDSGTATLGQAFQPAYPLYAPLLSVTVHAMDYELAQTENDLLVAGRIFYSVAKIANASQLLLVARAQCGNTLGIVPAECSGGGGGDNGQNT